MSIYGQGKPSGALGGYAYGRQERLDQKEQKVDIAGKEQAQSITQSEFFDWLDAAEARRELRKTSIAENKSRREVLPTETERTIEENVTQTKQTQSDRLEIDARREANLEALHTSMTEAQFDQVSRIYGAMSHELQQEGADPKAIYESYRQQFVNSARVPAEASKFLLSQGVPEQYSEEAMESFQRIANYGMHNAATVRQEHLMLTEWAQKIRLGQIEAAAKKATDVTYDPASADYKIGLGKLYMNHEWFQDMEGTLDADSGFTGDKGTFIELMTRMSRQVIPQMIGGDGDVNPAMVEMMGSEMMSMAHADYKTDNGTLWFGWRHGGDNFDSETMYNDMHTAMAVINNRRLMSPTESGRDFFTQWQTNKKAIVDELKARKRRAAATSGGGQGNTTGFGSGQNTSTNTQDAVANPRATDERPPVWSSAADNAKAMTPTQVKAELQMVNAKIRQFKTSIDSGDRTFWMEYQKLLDKRKNLVKELNSKKKNTGPR